MEAILGSPSVLPGMAPGIQYEDSLAWVAPEGPCALLFQRAGSAATQLGFPSLRLTHPICLLRNRNPDSLKAAGEGMTKYLLSYLLAVA